MSQVRMSTELGEMLFQLYPEQAPVSVANFLRYVELGLFNGSDFFRVVTLGHDQAEDPVKIETAQGGLNIDHSALLPSIIHESTQQSGLSHKVGSLSLARYAPGTANGSFFICLRDEPELDFGGQRQPDGLGFAVIGDLLSDRGVLQKIRQRAETDEYLSKPISINSVELVAS